MHAFVNDTLLLMANVTAMLQGAKSNYVTVMIAWHT